MHSLWIWHYRCVSCCESDRIDVLKYSLSAKSIHWDWDAPVEIWWDIFFLLSVLYKINLDMQKKKSKKDDLNRKSTKAFVEKHVVLFRAGKCLKWYIILLSVIFGIFIFSAFHYTLNYNCYSLIYNINIIGTFLPLRLAKDTVVVSSVNQKKRLILLNLFKEPLKWNSLVTRSDVFWLKIQIWENLAMNLCAFWLCSYSISVY